MFRPSHLHSFALNSSPSHRRTLQQPGMFDMATSSEHLVHRRRLMPTHHSIRCSLAFTGLFANFHVFFFPQDVMSIHSLIDKAMEVCDVFNCQRNLDSCLLHFRCSDFRQRPSVEICSSLCQLTSFSFRSAFHISKTVSLSFSCVVLLVKTYSFLCCFFFYLPNPFRQVGILDLRADILQSTPRQPSNTPRLWVWMWACTFPPRLRIAAMGPHFGSPGRLPFFKLRIESAVHWSDILCRNSTGPIHMPHAVPRGQAKSHHCDAMTESPGHHVLTKAFLEEPLAPTLCLQSVLFVGDNNNAICHFLFTSPATFPSTFSFPAHAVPLVPVCVPVSVSTTGTERT